LSSAIGFKASLLLQPTSFLPKAIIAVTSVSTHTWAFGQAAALVTLAGSLLLSMATIFGLAALTSGETPAQKTFLAAALATFVMLERPKSLLPPSKGATMFMAEVRAAGRTSAATPFMHVRKVGARVLA